MARFGRFKAFTVRAGAKLEARAISLIPVEKRLAKALQKKKTLRESLKAEQKLFAVFTADKKRSQNALILSLTAEKEAKKRVDSSDSPRDIARAESDLQTAQKLTRQNQNKIRLADIAIRKRALKIIDLTPKVLSAEKNVVSLETQAKAFRARKPGQLATARPRKAAKAKMKFGRSRRGFTTRSRKNKFN